MTPRIQELINDMFDTMYEANGVGLAAPQVGILKRIVVIDTTGEDPIVMINPRIIETSGEQTGGQDPITSRRLRLTKTWKRMKSKQPSFWRVQSAMKQIIWTVSCMCPR